MVTNDDGLDPQPLLALGGALAALGDVDWRSSHPTATTPPPPVR
jgi:hypothetical protein